MSDEPKKATVITPPGADLPIFSDAFGVTFGFNGFTADFGQVVTGSNTVYLRARITMCPPNQFKAFVECCEQALASYEKQYGPIKMTPEPSSVLFDAGKPSS